MRLGEIRGLEWDDVKLEARDPRVARSLSRGPVDTPKAGHGRTVDISPKPCARCYVSLSSDEPLKW